ncbi:hypothetical protein FHL15_008523 [Xylaria flabelliformis]|uniref:G domain-containing protein n=1 Tax=Xylaria flabelliformis TaxID=2512241 RepID=A0A553HRI4_9PEZI|nr:hypothetical protein FHL15_008523 [Xylaria flabelliformis]
MGSALNSPYGNIIHPSIFATLDWNAPFYNQGVFKIRKGELTAFLECIDDQGIPSPWLEGLFLLDTGVNAFIILVCGNTGVGKSTLINKVIGVEMTEESTTYDQGVHDINKTFESSNHPGLLIHDSRRWQAGSNTELNEIAKFLRHRAFQKKPAEALHVLWSEPRKIVLPCLANLNSWRYDSEDIRELIGDTLDLLTDEQVMRLGTHASRTAMAPLPTSSLIYTPTVSRILCEHVIQCFGFPKTTPEAVGEIMSTVVMKNLKDLMGVSLVHSASIGAVAVGAAIPSLGIVWLQALLDASSPRPPQRGCYSNGTPIVLKNNVHEQIDQMVALRKVGIGLKFADSEVHVKYLGPTPVGQLVAELDSNSTVLRAQPTELVGTSMVVNPAAMSELEGDYGLPDQTHPDYAPSPRHDVPQVPSMQFAETLYSPVDGPVQAQHPDPSVQPISDFSGILNRLSASTSDPAVTIPTQSTEDLVVRAKSSMNIIKSTMGKFRFRKS